MHVYTHVHCYSLFFHSFTKWDSESTYNVYLLNSSSNDRRTPFYGGILFFYLQRPITFISQEDGVNYTIGSQKLVTNFLHPSNVTSSSSEVLSSCRRRSDTTVEKDTTESSRVEGISNLKSLQESTTFARIMAHDEYNHVLDLVR